MAQPKKKPPVFRSQDIKLSPNHGWRATPGYKILVIGRGDLRFEYPVDWVHEFTDHSVKVRDKVFPKDVMLLEVSAIRTPPAATWAKVPSVADLLVDNLQKQGRMVTPDQIRRVESPGMELAWSEYPSIEEDPQTKLPRQATWRQAHAHAGKYHQGPYMPFGIVTFGFWSEFAHLADPVWEHFLQSLVLGQPIADPSKGPQYH